MVLIPEKPDIDDMPLSFGKYKGKTPNEILELDAGYLIWAYDNIEQVIMSDDLHDQACEERDIVWENQFNIY